MSSKIRPIGDKILLAIPEKDVESSVGGIIVKTKNLRESVREAAVRALPNGYVGALSVGDTVYVSPWAGTEVSRDGERLVFVKEKEIIAAAE